MYTMHCQLVLSCSKRSAVTAMLCLTLVAAAEAQPTCDQVWVVVELCYDAAGAWVALNAVQPPVSSRLDEVKT